MKYWVNFLLTTVLIIMIVPTVNAGFLCDWFGWFCDERGQLEGHDISKAKYSVTFSNSMDGSEGQFYAEANGYWYINKLTGIGKDCCVDPFPMFDDTIASSVEGNKVHFRNINLQRFDLIYEMDDEKINEILVIKNETSLYKRLDENFLVIEQELLFDPRLEVRYRDAKRNWHVWDEKTTVKAYKIEYFAEGVRQYLNPVVRAWDSNTTPNYMTSNVNGYDAYYELSKEGDTLILKKYFDYDWLESKDRVFPLYLDAPWDTTGSTFAITRPLYLAGSDVDDYFYILNSSCYLDTYDDLNNAPINSTWLEGIACRGLFILDGFLYTYEATPSDKLKKYEVGNNQSRESYETKTNGTNLVTSNGTTFFTCAQPNSDTCYMFAPPNNFSDNTSEMSFDLLNIPGMGVGGSGILDIIYTNDTFYINVYNGSVAPNGQMVHEMDYNLTSSINNTYYFSFESGEGSIGYWLSEDKFYSSTGADGNTVTEYEGVGTISTPAVLLETPINSSNITTADTSFNCSAEGSVNLDNVSFYLWDSSHAETNFSFTDLGGTSTTSNSSFNVTDLSAGNYTWNCFYRDTDNGLGYADLNNSVQITFIAPAVTLEYPPDGNVTGNSTSNFTCSALDSSVNIDNVTFELWNGTSTLFNSTFYDLTDSTTQNQSFFIENMNDGSYNWTCLYTNIDAQQGFASSNFSMTVDVSAPPTIELDLERNLFSNSSIRINYTFTESNPDDCFYSIDGGTTNTSFGTCGLNATVVGLGGDTEIFVFINDTLGSSDLDTDNVTALVLIREYNDTDVLETQRQDFAVEIANGSAVFVSGNLVYDEVTNSYTSFESNGSSLFINETITLPLVTGKQDNVTFFWNTTFRLGSEYANVSTIIRNQTIDYIELSNCTGGFVNPWINFTFRDSANNVLVNGSFTDSSFGYTLDLNYREIIKTLNFVNTSDTASIPFCFQPGIKNNTLSVNTSITYTATGFSSKKFAGNFNLTNVTTNQELSMLATADGQSVTFEVTNPAEQTLSGVSVTAEISSGGGYTTVETGTTDDAGTVTFYLNPDLSHRMTFSLAGYSDLIVFITPTATFYSVTMGNVAPSAEDNFYQGVNILITPTQQTLANRTNYTFSFVTSSTYWSLTNAGFRLFNGSGTELGGSSCSVATGCNASVGINTFNDTQITMNYFWVIQGNTTNGTRSWVVSETNSFNSSFNKLLSDLENLGEAFGEGRNGDFTKAIIAFFIILAITASLSFISGLRSPVAIMTVITGLTFFFDLIGWLPTSNIAGVGWIPYFPTILMGSILVGFIITEHIR